MIRKRREAVQAAANRLTTSPAAEQANGASPPDQSLPTSSAQKGTNPVAQQSGHPTENGTGAAAQNGTGPAQNGTGPAENGSPAQQNGTGLAQQNGTGPAQNGTGPARNGSPAQNGTTPAQNGDNSASASQPAVPPKTPVENGCVGDAVAPNNTAMASSSGCQQSQDQASSPPNTSPPSKGLNRASNGSAAPTQSSCMESVAPKGGVGTSLPAASNGGQQPAGAGAAVRSTAGSSTPMAVGQIHSPSANGSAGLGTGRLIAPGAVVMSETRQAATLAASTGSLPSGPTIKYVARSNGRGASSKAVTGPDPGVQAAAVAAGARIAPASTLLQAAHAGNGVHIRTGGVPVTKSGPSQTGMGHNASGGSRGTSGAIVHYITTQRPTQQTKNQAGKANGTSQASSSAAALNGSMSPTKSTPPPPK